MIFLHFSVIRLEINLLHLQMIIQFYDGQIQ